MHCTKLQTPHERHNLRLVRWFSEMLKSYILSDHYCLKKVDDLSIEASIESLYVYLNVT